MTSINYAYDGSDHVLTMTAVMPSGTPSQTTQYVYGTNSSSNLFSNDLLATTEYPDPTTGAASTASADEETTWYNALGQSIVYYDRNGDQHLLSYDVLGRLTQDFVGWWGFGTGVSQQTSGLGYTYNDAKDEKVTCVFFRARSPLSRRLRLRRGRLKSGGSGRMGKEGDAAARSPVLTSETEDWQAR